MIDNREEIKHLSNGVIECARRFTWDKRRDFFNSLYDKAIEEYRKIRYV
ncbi:MAG: hypothetical protein LBD53_08060 [Tannerella sp.]|nr:hypothetical protein [Tannerella sp.]